MSTPRVDERVHSSGASLWESGGLEARREEPNPKPHDSTLNPRKLSPMTFSRRASALRVGVWGLEEGKNRRLEKTMILHSFRESYCGLFRPLRQTPNAPTNCIDPGRTSSWLG